MAINSCLEEWLRRSEHSTQLRMSIFDSARRDSSKCVNICFLSLSVAQPLRLVLLFHSLEKQSRSLAQD